MGREIRRVPANWKHPEESRPNHRLGCMEMRAVPLHDQDADSAWIEWLAEFARWNAGEHARVANEYGADKYPMDQPYRSFCDWNGAPPRAEAYRPKWSEGEATWYQVYETVSEGTPVTPPFKTQAELVEYLVASGDFWDQSRRKEQATRGYSGFRMQCDPWSRDQTERFVYGAGWEPSMIIANGKVMSGVEGMAEVAK